MEWWNLMQLPLAIDAVAVGSGLNEHAENECAEVGDILYVPVGAGVSSATLYVSESRPVL
jgi:hypothetical protein